MLLSLFHESFRIFIFIYCNYNVLAQLGFGLAWLGCDNKVNYLNVTAKLNENCTLQQATNCHSPAKPKPVKL